MRITKANQLKLEVDEARIMCPIVLPSEHFVARARRITFGPLGQIVVPPGGIVMFAPRTEVCPPEERRPVIVVMPGGAVAPAPKPETREARRFAAKAEHLGGDIEAATRLGMLAGIAHTISFGPRDYVMSGPIATGGHQARLVGEGGRGESRIIATDDFGSQWDESWQSDFGPITAQIVIGGEAGSSADRALASPGSFGDRVENLMLDATAASKAGKLVAGVAAMNWAQEGTRIERVICQGQSVAGLLLGATHGGPDYANLNGVVVRGCEFNLMRHAEGSQILPRSMVINGRNIKVENCTSIGRFFAGDASTEYPCAENILTRAVSLTLDTINAESGLSVIKLLPSLIPRLPGREINQGCGLIARSIHSLSGQVVIDARDDEQAIISAEMIRAKYNADQLEDSFHPRVSPRQPLLALTRGGAVPFFSVVLGGYASRAQWSHEP